MNFDAFVHETLDHARFLDRSVSQAAAHSLPFLCTGCECAVSIVRARFVHSPVTRGQWISVAWCDAPLAWTAALAVLRDTIGVHTVGAYCVRRADFATIGIITEDAVRRCECVAAVLSNALAGTASHGLVLERGSNAALPMCVAPRCMLLHMKWRTPDHRIRAGDSLGAVECQLLRAPKRPDVFRRMSLILARPTAATLNGQLTVDLQGSTSHTFTPEVAGLGEHLIVATCSVAESYLPFVTPPTAHLAPFRVVSPGEL